MFVTTTKIFSFQNFTLNFFKKNILYLPLIVKKMFVINSRNYQL